MRLNWFSPIDFAEQLRERAEKSRMCFLRLEVVCQGCGVQFGGFVSCTGIRACQDVGRFLIGVLAERAYASVVMTAFEKLRAHTGTPRDELPSPRLHSRGKVLDRQVECTPVDPVESLPRDGEIVMLTPMLFDCWSADRGAEVVCSESGLLTAV